MKLALRHELPAASPSKAEIGAAAIEARLVTRYAHGGVVIGDTLYHSNAAHGVHAEPFVNTDGWVLIDLGEMRDARALSAFSRVQGAGYDWFSLLAFIVPAVSDSQRYYCFELCFLLMTNRNPRERVTPETLLALALQMGGRLITPLPSFRSLEIHDGR